MRHWLPSAAALLSAFWTLSATALGLGEMSVESGLNQRFVARIPLTLNPSDDASAVRVALAPNAEFERAGLERPAFLSDLRFEVVSDGSVPHVTVTSTQIAREPIVMLLVEARDTSSRVLREYTVFLDPPYFGPGTPAEVSTPVAAAATPLVTPPPTPMPVVAATPVPTLAPTSAPASTAQPTSSQFYETAEESTRAPAPEATPAPSKPAAAATAPTASDFGPVTAGQTLWSIATTLRPDPAVTMDQMLLALYRGNPGAFEGGINGLMKGSVLRVPSRDEITAVDAEAARLEVRRLRGLDRPAPARSSKPTPAPAVTPAPTPIATPVPTAQPTPLPTRARPEKPTASGGPISLPAKPTATPAALPTAELAPDLPIVESTTDAGTSPGTEQAAAEATADSAASEQGSSESAAATAEPEVTATPVPAAAEQDEIVSQSLPKRESSLLETLLIPLILGLVVLGGIGYLISRVLARRKAGADSGAGAAHSIRKPAVSTPKPMPAAAAPVAAAALDDEPELAVAATQQVETRQFELPPAAVADADRAPSMDATQAFSVPPPAEPEPVDFDLTGQFESQTMQIDLDTNDPVSEADFHLAYGLYDEAALLLKQAAEREPGRGDIRTKLAETYFAAGKPAEFQIAAEDARPLVSAADWQKIAIMGQQLCPDVAMFQEDVASGDVGSTDFDLGALGESVADGGDAVSLGTLETESDVAAPMATATDSGTLDFKLDEFDIPAVEPLPADTVNPAPQDNALEFDLSQFDLSQPGEAEAEPSTESVPQENAVDFDLDLSGFDSGSPTEAAVPAELADTPVEFDVPAAPESEVSSAAMSDLGAGLDFKLDEVESPPPSDVPEIRLDDIDLGEMPTESVAAGDEVGTKLDLARAYVDMGDSEMARSLLDEVIAQGSEQQKQDAQDLLTRLG